MSVLAQATPEIGTFEWWSSFGIAGALVFVALGFLVCLFVFGLWFLRDLWKTRKPHYIAKLKAETEKEEAQAQLFKALTEAEPAKVVAQQQTAALLDKVTERQDDTHSLVKEIHAKVQTWKHFET